MTLTIAAGQLESVPGDIEANVATAVSAVTAARGARILVLPELFLCGYVMPAIAVDIDDPRLAPLDAVATEARMIVLVGAALSDGPTISMLAIGGGVRAVYAKQHLCGEEQRHFVPGNGGVVLDVDGWKLGLAICYDGCFPEHARAAADAGAEVYVAPVAYFAGSEHRRDLYYRARALDNGIFSVVSGLVGDCGGALFNGGSAIHDPEGRTLASVTDFETGIAVATLDRAIIESTRAAHPMYAERRADLGGIRTVRLD